MPRSKATCPQPGCPNLTAGGRCPAHRPPERPSARQRGYDHEHETRFRAGVLARNPVCVLCKNKPAVVADHWPVSRRDLVRQGRDPNDPRYGRGLCRSCDSTQTAHRQPGGWNRW